MRRLADKIKTKQERETRPGWLNEDNQERTRNSWTKGC